MELLFVQMKFVEERSAERDDRNEPWEAAGFGCRGGAPATPRPSRPAEERAGLPDRAGPVDRGDLADHDGRVDHRPLLR